MSASRDLFQFRMALTRLFVEEPVHPWTKEALFSHVAKMRERSGALRAALWAIRDVTSEEGSPSHEADSRALSEDDKWTLCYLERPENNVWSASADDARRTARKHRATAERERHIRSGVVHGAIKETRFRQYVMACVLAAEMRAETERRIAAMFEVGEREVYSRAWESNT